MNEERRIDRLLRKKISSVLTGEHQTAADEGWGIPGEETVRNHPWYVSRGAVAEDARRVEAGLEPQLHISCVSSTWWWIEQATCEGLGHDQEWISQCELCVPRLHKHGPPGMHGRSNTQPCDCVVCVVNPCDCAVCHE